MRDEDEDEDADKHNCTDWSMQAMKEGASEASDAPWLYHVAIQSAPAFHFSETSSSCLNAEWHDGEDLDIRRHPTSNSNLT